jgi:D-threo-aldose 1-dehydrogenase
MAEVIARRRLGTTEVEVTELGFGGASLGELFVPVSEKDALATLDAAWDSGIRYFDTAPWYGRGLSELRIGSGLRDHPREDFALSTKVGRWLRPARGDAVERSPWVGGSPNEVVFDYTYDGIMRSVEQSRLRLGITRFDVAFIHDLDRLYFDEETYEAHFRDLRGSGWKALEELRSSGQVRAVGAGINALGLIPRFLDAVAVDAFLVAMPYTLLKQEILDDELPAATARGIGFVIGAVFQSGILATGAVEGATYDYAPAPPEVMDRVRRIEAVCERHAIPLAAAALRFPLGHPAVAAVIPGAFHPDQVRRNVVAFAQPIPADFWAELKHEGLLRADAPVPDAPVPDATVPDATVPA